MASVIVLGAGQVGASVARGLARDGDLEVAAADANPDALRRLKGSDGVVRTLPVDLMDGGSLTRVLDGRDLAIVAVPGPIGFETLRRVLAAGTDAVSVSFFDQDPFELHEPARRRGRVAVVDAGLAPGLSNLILGHWEARLRSVARFECLVGGLPAEPSPPWEYMAPVSPVDVIAEYTRPVRLRRQGEDRTLPALSEVETVELPHVGTLEAFPTDRLRTLLRTSRAPELTARTLRWPGHAARVRLLRETGFLSEEPVELDDAAVAPIELSRRLLSAAWRYDPDAPDLTVLRVVVEGDDDEGRVRHRYELLDRSDGSGESSMARATGGVATALARLLLESGYREPGVSPPELLGAADGTLGFVLEHLAARGITVSHDVERA